jgi:hypothetical protein
VSSQITYPPDRGALLLRLIGCIGFVIVAVWAAMGYAANPSRIVAPAVLVACGGYFAFVGAAYIGALLDQAGLAADETGFSYRVLWQRRRLSWQEVSEFQAANYRMLRVIAFNRPAASDDWRTRMNRRVIGVSDFIVAHNFRAPLEEVCRTLNEFRSRAIARI